MAQWAQRVLFFLTELNFIDLRVEILVIVVPLDLKYILAYSLIVLAALSLLKSLIRLFSFWAGVTCTPTACLSTDKALLLVLTF